MRPRQKPTTPSLERRPRSTIRARLARFYFGAFLVTGAVLLAVTVALWQGGSRVRATSVAAVPRRGDRGRLAVPGGGPLVVQHSSDLHQLIIAAAIALALMAAVSLALGWLVASHFLVPLRSITSTTRDISATNLHERLNVAGPDDEIKELADTFDDLLERLEQAFDFERQFVANASHELRTPLATMRASLDVAMAKPARAPEYDGARRAAPARARPCRPPARQLRQPGPGQPGPAADEATVSLDEAVAAAIGERSGAILGLGLTVDQELCGGAWPRAARRCWPAWSTTSWTTPSTTTNVVAGCGCRLRRTAPSYA